VETAASALGRKQTPEFIDIRFLRTQSGSHLCKSSNFLSISIREMKLY
jgi:hypothetical protein